ncbi:MAG: VCBS repeat-containing protein [Pyrinomonadaceae bacterium]|nr:VCBS repeat-containing protein [Pyrinomonadaceae bacterium]
MKFSKVLSVRAWASCIVAIAFVGVLYSGVSAQKVRLRAQITPNCGSSSNLKFADIYADGNIAVQGSYNCRGAFIYDMTNPDAPVLASWYNPGANQQFLEAIVVGTRGYFGSGNGGGVHIVDLANPYSPQLLGIVNAANGNGHGSIHEMMVINQFGSDILIENFNGTSNKIIKFIDVSIPNAAVFLRDLSPTEPQWVHAMHVRGDRMFTSGWGNSTNKGRTEIYNIANIASTPPQLLGFITDASPTITAGNSMHSSWSSEDGNFLYSCRETSNGNGDLRTYNITNPAVPLLVNSIGMNALGLNAVTPHNPVVMGNKLYIAWYQAGIQVFDISTPSTPTRVAQYDTFPTVFAPPAEEKAAALEAEPWDLVCGSDFRQNVLPTSYDGNWAVFPFLGQDKILAGDLKFGLFVLDASSVTAQLKNRVSDFDGDGKTDLATFTPASGNWGIENSSNAAFASINFGFNTDKLTPGDYDGDGKTDLAIYRPSTGTWWIRRSTNPGNFQAIQFGVSTDIPVEADYDADGKTDVAVFRPSTGVWYIQQSTLGFKAMQWGISTDIPVVGDFEGDGKPDIAVWRPSNGVWYVSQSSSSIPFYSAFGTSGDKPVSADFNGNGVSDFAVYRPSTGTWYSLDPATQAFSAYNFGLAEDMPIPADYDGDGKADIAVFRPSTNVWYRLNSNGGSFFARVFGQSADVPTAASVQP